MESYDPNLYVFGSSQLSLNFLPLWWVDSSVKWAYIDPFKVRGFLLLHSLQPVCGVCVWREKPHWWHRTAHPPAAQTAMRKKARQSLWPVRRSPKRPSPRGLARRPFGSPWTPKMRGQFSAGTHAHTPVTYSPPPTPVLSSALVEPLFPSKLFPCTILLPPSLFFSDIALLLSVPSFLISPWLQSIQTSSQTVCCAWGPLLWSVECFHEVEWRI